VQLEVVLFPFWRNNIWTTTMSQVGGVGTTFNFLSLGRYKYTLWLCNFDMFYVCVSGLLWKKKQISFQWYKNRHYFSLSTSAFGSEVGKWVSTFLMSKCCVASLHFKNIASEDVCYCKTKVLKALVATHLQRLLNSQHMCWKLWFKLKNWSLTLQTFLTV